MLTIDRPLSDERHPEETPKERITFSMPKQEIDQVGKLLIIDFLTKEDLDNTAFGWIYSMSKTSMESV